MSGGVSALITASMHNDIDAVQKLLMQGTDINATDEVGCTALHWAAMKGNREICEMICIRPNCLLESAKAGAEYTPLHIAAAYGKDEIVLLLLGFGANITARAGWNVTALHLAAANGHLLAVDVLLERSAPMELRTDTSRTPLHTAASMGHEYVVRELIGRGADKLSRCEQGLTLLHLAARKGHEDVVRYLLDAGLDKDIKTDFGKTAQELARENEHVALATLLENYHRETSGVMSKATWVSSASLKAAALEAKDTGRNCCGMLLGGSGGEDIDDGPVSIDPSSGESPEDRRKRLRRSVHMAEMKRDQLLKGTRKNDSFFARMSSSDRSGHNFNRSLPDDEGNRSSFSSMKAAFASMFSWGGNGSEDPSDDSNNGSIRSVQVKQQQNNTKNNNNRPQGARNREKSPEAAGGAKKRGERKAASPPKSPPTPGGRSFFTGDLEMPDSPPGTSPGATPGEIKRGNEILGDAEESATWSGAV